MILGLREYVVLTITLLSSVLVMSIIASGGGVWSSSDIGTFQFNNTISLASFHFEFGLGGYSYQIGEIDKPTYIDYGEEVNRLTHEWVTRDKTPSSDSSPLLLLDYQDAMSGGNVSSAFMAFAIIFSLLLIGMHLMLWPVNKHVPLVHKGFLPITCALIFCFLMSFLAWNAMGHTAAERIAYDRYTVSSAANISMPDVDRGWCYSVAVTCCVLTLLSGVSSYFAQKSSLERPEVFNALADSSSVRGGLGSAFKTEALPEAPAGGSGYTYDEM